MQQQCQSFQNANNQAPFSLNEQPQIKLIPCKNQECPNIKNHSAIYYNGNIYLFGGYDGKKNHNTLHIFNIEKCEWSKGNITGKEPDGRNGHTATLVNNKMFVIGGWLGSGTYASCDLYILNLDTLEWIEAMTFGTGPGPCNMHSADVVNNLIYIFRGGDGKDYLNDLHALHIESLQWSLVETRGEAPPPRANHSSAFLNNNLYIFGGWDGQKRLNDLYFLDILQMTWTEVRSYGINPSPRAGMTLSAVNGKLYLFGGSGPSASCYNDLQMYDVKLNMWTMASVCDPENIVKARAGHSTTVVDDKLYIIGGSCGSSYYKNFFVLDTDPAPDIKGSYLQIQEGNTSNSRMKQCLKDLLNKPDFSDIQFVVQGHLIYSHKVILSLLSERFREMFSSGMKESQENKIVIEHISYEVFLNICSYLYSGEVQFRGEKGEDKEQDIQYLLTMCQASDEFILDEIKVECEKRLAKLINDENFSLIQKYAEQCNAPQLKRYCDWYINKCYKQKQYDDNNNKKQLKPQQTPSPQDN